MFNAVIKLAYLLTVFVYFGNAFSGNDGTYKTVYITGKSMGPLPPPFRQFLHKSKENLLIDGSRETITFDLLRKKLSGRINSDTLIYVSGHGTTALNPYPSFLYFFDWHKISLADESEPTKPLVEFLDKLVDGPSQIVVDSCLSGRLDTNFDIKKESVLILFSDLGAGAISEMITMNHLSANPYQNFAEQMPLYAAQKAIFYTSSKRFVLSPPIRAAFEMAEAHHYLQATLEDFKKFSSGFLWKWKEIHSRDWTASTDHAATLLKVFFYMNSGDFFPEEQRMAFKDIIEKTSESDFPTELEFQNHDGASALAVAVEMGDLFLTQKFIASNIFNLHIKNSFGFSLLRLAAKKGHLEIFTKLLAAGVEHEEENFLSSIVNGENALPYLLEISKFKESFCLVDRAIKNHCGMACDPRLRLNYWIEKTKLNQLKCAADKSFL